MSRALLVGASVALAGCAPQTSQPSGSCEGEAWEWVAPSDPLAISVVARGALAWSPGSPSMRFDGTLLRAEGTDSTVLVVDASAGEVELEVGVAADRLGVLPIGDSVTVVLADGLSLLDTEGRVALAVVSSRGAEEASASESLSFRQAYAECVRARADGACSRAMAEPLVDIVSGASVVRVPPGGRWLIPNEESPTAEIEVVRSVRAPAADELWEIDGPLCADAPATELAVIVRHLR